MGDSLPPPAEFDLVDSFARLRGADAEIVLAAPKTELADSGVAVRLAHGGRTVEAPASVSGDDAGRRLTVRVARSRLADGIWSLSVIRPDGSEAPLAARLLVQGRRPLVLLWGAKGGRSHVPKGRPNDPRRRALRAGSRAFDRALAVLPEDRARRVRATARAAARKVLG